MKNNSSMKSSQVESPKTPGGISKSLLTPCRRVGLSRNWKKNGPSPFNSPLASNVEVKQDSYSEEESSRKRKERIAEEISTPEVTLKDSNSTNETDKTPSRNVELPRRKKSKILLSALNESYDISELKSVDTDDKPKQYESSFGVTTDTSVKLKTNSEILSKNKINNSYKPMIETLVSDTNQKLLQNDEPQTSYNKKAKSPNNLSKECIVVIQKKIYKKNITLNEHNEGSEHNVKNMNKKMSRQHSSDSDSDDIPLIDLNKKETSKEKKVEESIPLNCMPEDDDFAEKDAKVKIKQNDHHNPLKRKSLETKKAKQDKNVTTEPKSVTNNEVLKLKGPSINSFDDDDDDFAFDNKRTILIKKTYDKVSKPLKAKSTGSITQSDIDNLRARIETKKKRLLAKSMTEDTEELRTLVKKWQKGCQDALMELMDLMKNKLPDKQNMDYSQILKTLKIPANLVGYDSDNDCFNTPDDSNIVLANFNDI